MNELDSFAVRMLNFVEDSVNEALEDQSSRRALLSEADCALRVLEKTLRREDHTKLAQLLLLDTFNVSFRRT